MFFYSVPLIPGKEVKYSQYHGELCPNNGRVKVINKQTFSRISMRSKLRRFMELFKNNWDNPLFYRSLLFILLVRPYYRGIKKPKGKSILEEEWDHLIILDACRYDRFSQIFQNDFAKKLDLEYCLNSRVSLSSHTREFLKKNFSGKYLGDIVYITASPMVDAFAEGKFFNCKPGKFYKIVSVWRYAWNEEIGTVLPEDVTKYAIETYEKYPDKRLIVHYIQPHYPFILNREVNISNDLKYVVEKRSKGLEVSDHLTKKLFDNIYFLSKYIDERTFWEAYDSNLRLVLKEALKLAKNLEGKIIITSDHGEAYKKRIWFPIPISISGHPEGVYIDDLILVPWLEIHNEVKRHKHSKERVKIKSAVNKLSKRLQSMNQAK